MYSLHANQVVLAAGAFENTRLVGQILADVRGVSEIAFPGINDHIVQGFFARVPATVLPVPDTPQRAFCFSTQHQRARSNLFWEILPSSRTGQIIAAVWTMGEKYPSESAVIVRRSPHSDVADVGVVNPLTGSDLEVAAAQIELLEETLERLLQIPRDRLALNINNYADGQPAWTDAARLADGGVDGDGTAVLPYVYPLGSVDHESGTLPLGRVIDNYGRLPELLRVSVLGTATFPRSGAANPSLTTLALAARHALTWNGCVPDMAERKASRVSCLS